MTIELVGGMAAVMIGALAAGLGVEMLVRWLATVTSWLAVDSPLMRDMGWSRVERIWAACAVATLASALLVLGSWLVLVGLKMLKGVV